MTSDVGPKLFAKPTLCCLLAALLNIASTARAQGGFCDPEIEKTPKQYAQQQKKYHFSVVYTQCLDITSNGKMVLVFPLTVYKSLDLPDQRDPTFDRDFEEWPGIPLMLEYGFDGCIDNVAKLQADKKGFFVSLVLSGGMATEAELDKEINKIIRHHTMHYLPPDRVEDFVRAKPDHDCPR